MIPSIAIVGSRVEGWMAAAALAAALKGRARIELIAAPDDRPDDGAEGTLPSIRGFHARVGLDEDELIRRTGATFRLGSELTGWTGPGSRFFHPFGPFGSSIGAVGFHHGWLRLRALGEGGALEDYSLAAAAARLGRFQRPSSDPASVLSSYDYGLHLDLGAYADHLRGFALAHGVVQRPTLAGVRLDGADGAIAALALEDGGETRADLYVDCTASGRLIRQALGAPWLDWSQWLPCDRMVSAAAPPAGDPEPYTRIEAAPSGWARRIPLQDRTVSGQVYCSSLTSDAGAADGLAGAPSVQSIQNGRCEAFWIRNCVAIGEAGGQFEPLAASRLDLAQSGLQRLIGLLPDGAPGPAEAAELNRLAVMEHDRIRDFLILHHWAPRQGAGLPDDLAQKIEVFRARGRVALLAEETFLAPSWLAAFTGLEVWPRRHHPFADAIDLAELRGRLSDFRTVIRQAAESMTGHRSFLDRDAVQAPAQ